jgi:hypothetical protein
VTSTARTAVMSVTAVRRLLRLRSRRNRRVETSQLPMHGGATVGRAVDVLAMHGQARRSGVVACIVVWGDAVQLAGKHLTAVSASRNLR